MPEPHAHPIGGYPTEIAPIHDRVSHVGVYRAMKDGYGFTVNAALRSAKERHKALPA